MKLKEEVKDGTVRVSEMKEGQIAIVRHWSNSTPIDRIVTRYGHTIYVLGQDTGFSYTPIPDNDRCRVEILKGEHTFII